MSVATDIARVVTARLGVDDPAALDAMLADRRFQTARQSFEHEAQIKREARERWEAKQTDRARRETLNLELAKSDPFVSIVVAVPADMPEARYVEERLGDCDRLKVGASVLIERESELAARIAEPDENDVKMMRLIDAGVLVIERLDEKRSIALGLRRIRAGSGKGQP